MGGGAGQSGHPASTTRRRPTPQDHHVKPLSLGCSSGPRGRLTDMPQGKDDWIEMTFGNQATYSCPGREAETLA